MSRYIDGEKLYESVAEWEAQALHMVEVTMNDEDLTEWRRWSAILKERSAFKFDVADMPTAEVAEVVRCKDCVHRDPEDKRCDCGGHEWVIGKVLPVEDEWFCAEGKKMDEVEE